MEKIAVQVIEKGISPVEVVLAPGIKWYSAQLITDSRRNRKIDNNKSFPCMIYAWMLLLASIIFQLVVMALFNVFRAEIWE